MSSSIIKARGGSKDLLGSKGQVANTGLLITNTKVGKEKAIHMSGLEGLISNTKGVLEGTPVMDGIITSTKTGFRDKDVPELHKVHHRGKTQPKTMGQVPFAGPKY